MADLIENLAPCPSDASGSSLLYFEPDPLDEHPSDRGHRKTCKLYNRRKYGWKYEGKGKPTLKTWQIHSYLHKSHPPEVVEAYEKHREDAIEQNKTIGDHIGSLAKPNRVGHHYLGSPNSDIRDAIANNSGVVNPILPAGVQWETDGGAMAMGKLQRTAAQQIKDEDKPKKKDDKVDESPTATPDSPKPSYSVKRGQKSVAQDEWEDEIDVYSLRCMIRREMNDQKMAKIAAKNQILNAKSRERKLEKKKQMQETKRKLVTSSEVILPEYEEVESFHTFRLRFLRTHLAEIVEMFTRGFHRVITRIELAPVQDVVYKKFRDNNSAISPVLVFHGTNVANYASIFLQGLKVPGTGGVGVANGSAYGVGIYTAVRPDISFGYARGGKSMLICAAKRNIGQVGDHGDILVLFDACLVVPLFVIHWNETFERPTQTNAPPVDNQNKNDDDEKETLDLLYEIIRYFSNGCALQEYARKIQKRQLRCTRDADRHDKRAAIARLQREESMVSV